MKKSQLLAILALALALGLAPATNIYAAEGEEVPAVVSEEGDNTPAPQEEPAEEESTPAPAAADTATVANAADLQTAVDDPAIKTINLSGDITVAGSITINRNAEDMLTINLGTHKIESDGATNARIFVINNGNLEIKNGTVDASSSVGGMGVKLVGHDVANDMTVGSYVVIASDATIKAGSTDSAYGVAIYQKPGTNKAMSTGVDLYGTIDATNGACGITVLGNVTDSNVKPVIAVVGGTINAADTGIYAAGNAFIYVVDGAEITGGTGITLKAGTLEVIGSTVKGTAAFTPVPEGSMLNNNGAAPTGAAIQVESNGSYAGEVTIEVYGDSTIESTNGPAIYGYGDRANNEAVESIIIEEGSKLIAGGSYEAIDGVAKESIEEIEKYVPGQGGGEEETPKPVEEAPETGVVNTTSEAGAKHTASVMAAIATALTAAGSIVVARRAQRRSNKQN